MADDKRWREVFKKLDEINEKLDKINAALGSEKPTTPKPAPVKK